MVAIVTGAFGGERPISQPRLLQDMEAQLAQNVRLNSGRIEPLKGTTDVTTIAAAVTSIFRWAKSGVADTTGWFFWADDVQVVRSPIANDQWDRIYWTGEGVIANANIYPRYSPVATYQAGSVHYRLGIPKPTGVPSATGTAVSNPTKETRSYVITYVDAATNPTVESLPSKEITVYAADGFPVSFTALPTSNEGDTRVTHKRLYRKVSNTYRLVTTLTLAAEEHEDSVTNAALGSAAALSATLASAVAAPANAPVATTSGTPSAAGSYDRKYVVTFYSGEYTYTQNNGDGGSETITVNIDESLPSPEITVSGVYDGQAVTISNIGATGVTVRGGWHIYRKIEGIGQSSWKRVGSIPYTQVSFVDNTRHGSETQQGYNSTYYTDSTKKPVTPIGAKDSSFVPSSVIQRVYCMTFWNGTVESPPSPVSNTINVTDGQSVSLSISASAPTGVTHKRLYRKLQSGANTTFRQVVQVASSQLSYTDTLTDSAISGNALIPATYANVLPTPQKTPTVSAEIPETKIPESRTYVYTYVSAYGEEGPPSPASEVIDIDPELAVTVTGMSAAPSGPYNITHKRIYRSSTVGSQAEFQLVPVTWEVNGALQTGTDVPVAITTVSDETEQSDLAEVLPSETWEPPPAKLFSLKMLANGIACGFVKDSMSRTVVFSEAFLPHAWPPEYSHVTDDEIVGIGVFRQSVAVLTTAYPYVISGIDPSAMTMTKLELKQSCVSSKSIVETGDGVVYASPDGLFMIGNGGVQNMTASLFSREQWQELNPPSMQSFFHDGRIHLVYTTTANARGMLIFDFTGQGALLTRATVSSEIKGGYSDAATDTLYLMQDGKIVRFNRGSDLAYTWKSKLFRTPFPLNFACGQVLAESYPVTLKVYAHDSLKLTKIVNDAKIFTLPSGFRAYDWHYEVSNATTVNGVTTINPSKVFLVSIAQSPAEIKAT